MIGLKDKVIIVAGGATGLGAASAKRLAQEGAKVLVADLNEAGATKTVDTIKAAGGIAEKIVFDISKEEDCKMIVDKAKELWGRIDGLYNVAADLSKHNLGRDTDVVNVPNDVIERTFKVNTVGFMFTSRYAIPAMIENGGGSIVNMVSSAGAEMPIYVCYGMSKSAVGVLTKHIATTYGKQSIRCNAIDPSITITENQLESVTDETRAEILPTIRNTRFGKPEDIAAMVAFLMSEECEWLNGQILAVSSNNSYFAM